MKYKICVLVLTVYVLSAIGGEAVRAQNSASKSPRVFLLNSRILQENKAKKTATAAKAALAELERDAQSALKIDIASIITKSAAPPSGDKRDYMSQAPYFWKNPQTKTGFPYVRRDGERNPEIKRFPDHDLLDRMIETVETLAFAYYFTEREEYANRAAEILRLWFVNNKTKMNPNLEYAQAIPGLNTGRGIGIIETRGLTRVVDAVGLIGQSKAWTTTDQTNLQKWFSTYLNWLTTSKNGRDEAAAKNNHGTFYDVQVASFALFVGQNDFAAKILEAAKLKRLAVQIAANGEQPLELERTKSWDYSVMNLDGLIALATLGEHVGVDLWNFQAADQSGIRRAIEFLAEFIDDRQKWKHQQIDVLKPEKLFPAIRRAADRYTDEKFTKIKQAPTTTVDWRRLADY